MQSCNYPGASTCRGCQTCGLGKVEGIITRPTWQYAPNCEVPGCNCAAPEKRGTQRVCDICRRRFIREPTFRLRLAYLKIIPD